MLKKFRERKNIKLILLITAILIIPAFIFWGVGSTLRTRGDNLYAGIAFSKKITKTEFLKQYQAVYNQAQLLYGENISKLQDYLNLEGQAWQRIILLHVANNKKIKITNKEIVAFIKNSPLFQKEGTFDTDTYNTILKYYMGLNPREYEEQVHNNLKISKLIEEVTLGITATDEEAWQAHKKENAVYKFSYVLLKPSEYSLDTEYSEEKLITFYQTHKEQFKKPEQVNLFYLAVKPDSFVSDADITDIEIQDYYQQHKSTWEETEESEENETSEESEEPNIISDKIQSEISEILKKTAAKNIAEDLIWKVQDGIESGLTFKESATKNNLEVKGTGFFSPWDPIPGIGWAYKITQQAFSLSIGEISDIIEIQDVFYIIELIDKKNPHIPEFDEIKAAVEESFKTQLREKAAKEDAQEKLDKIIELLATKGSIDEFLKEHDLALKETDYLSRSQYIAQVGNASDVIDNLKTATLGDFNPEIIKCAAGYIIVKIEDITAPLKDDFEKNKTQLTEQLLTKKKEQHLNDWFNQIKERADLEIYFKIPR
ncbi:MAG: peptidylprolyl isomerase [Candidatus Saelkia tenebricola]|nr:peptidylprolyl isomerase [Candidatus Saelkia tenebricola]